MKRAKSRRIDDIVHSASTRVSHGTTPLGALVPLVRERPALVTPSSVAQLQRVMGNAAMSSVVTDLRRASREGPSPGPQAAADGRVDLSLPGGPSVQRTRVTAASVVPFPPMRFTGGMERAVGHAKRRLPALHGKTTAEFNSTSRTEDLTTEPGERCRRCRGPSCVHVTGTLVSEFTVTTHVRLPRPPCGLSECERAQVQ